jgi:hypothetical protein
MRLLLTQGRRTGGPGIDTSLRSGHVPWRCCGRKLRSFATPVASTASPGHCAGRRRRALERGVSPLPGPGRLSFRRYGGGTSPLLWELSVVSSGPRPVRAPACACKSLISRACECLRERFDSRPAAPRPGKNETYLFALAARPGASKVGQVRRRARSSCNRSAVAAEARRPEALLVLRSRHRLPPTTDTRTSSVSAQSSSGETLASTDSPGRSPWTTQGRGHARGTRSWRWCWG